MATKAKTKAAGTNLPVPQSDAEAELMIAQLGALQRDQAALKAKHDGTIAELEAAYGVAVKQFQERQTAMTDGLAIWASAHRERLTQGGRIKTVQLATGTILWRDGRYAVKYRGAKVEGITGAIQDLITQLDVDIPAAQAEDRRDDVTALTAKRDTLAGFLRHKVDLDKMAMLASREIGETVPGVTVSRGPEEFAVEPLASQIREVA
ncbi:host-nuclease inhibitor Gam family protein [Methylobacterium aquaticum]|uniref:host-nuclease inhibitor Gam family protein n=1 Tax=Methylobacterium aquaticum TaxID=270351 RepID=UPI003D16552D